MIRYFLILLLFASFSARGQKRYNVWPFGDSVGLDFNNGTVKGIFTATEGDRWPYNTASVCDTAGRLLFYTDGYTMWNATHNKMPVWRAWWPWAGKVTPLICPYPGNDSLHYVFGVSDKQNPNKLLYFTTKLRNPGDLEEAVYPQPTSINYFTVLADNASRMLAGTAHCNQKDTWITTHEPGVLKNFLITTSGINPDPVVSTIPASVLPVEKLEAAYSNIKYAANGERMIVPVFAGNRLVVFDFDNQSGRFSNPVSIGLPDNYVLEDFEMSPDGSKLYVGAYEVTDIENDIEMHYVVQMDLNAGSPAQVEASMVRLNDLGDRDACSPRGSCIWVERNMQLGPDGKIYVNMRDIGNSRSLDSKLSVIEEPNKKGLDARYRRTLVSVDRKYKMLGYQYIRSGSYSLRENGIQFRRRTCAGQPVQFNLLFNRVDSVKWEFGDPASGSNTSTDLNPQHQYPGPGTYTVKAIIYSRCLVDTATSTVRIDADIPVKVPDSIKDTIVCTGSKLELNASMSSATAYTWDNGLIYPDRVIDQPGTYMVTLYNDCSVDRKAFEVVYKDCPCQVFVPNAFTPNNDGKNDVFRPGLQCFVKEYRLTIYHRYGNKAFETSDPFQGWTGKSGNSSLFPSGVYVWMIEYRNPNNNEFVRKSGTVTLIR
jgi:gliding motility-associated-like protein